MHNCSTEHDHEHDHDHDDHSDATGPADNLYQHIDIANVALLNIADDAPVSSVIKPWHNRLDEALVSTLLLLLVLLLGQNDTHETDPLVP